MLLTRFSILDTSKTRHSQRHLKIACRLQRDGKGLVPRPSVVALKISQFIDLRGRIHFYTVIKSVDAQTWGLRDALRNNVHLSLIGHKSLKSRL